MGVVELNDYLTDWAKEYLDESETQQLKAGSCRLDVDTSKVRMSSTEQTFPPLNVEENGSPPGVVFQSRYVNRTDTEQEHTFIMERSTEATVTTKLKHGFTRNGTVGIKLDVPEDVSQKTGGFGSEVIVESEDENTVKHSLTWSINSKVNAPPRKTTVAELRITEDRFKCEFTATVILKGRVIIKLVEVSSGQVVRFIGGDLATVLNDLRKKTTFKPSESEVGINIEDRKVSWSVSGTLNFRFGVSQDVEVAYGE